MIVEPKAVVTVRRCMRHGLDSDALVFALYTFVSVN